MEIVKDLNLDPFLKKQNRMDSEDMNSAPINLITFMIVLFYMLFFIVTF